MKRRINRFMPDILQRNFQNIALLYRAGRENAMENLNIENSKENPSDENELVKKVKQAQPQEEYLYDLAELFKTFGDSTRIKILYALFESELCVGDIAQVLNFSQSSVSHQLRILKDAKLVKFRREGKNIYYSLDDDHVRMMISMGMEHIEE